MKNNLPYNVLRNPNDWSNVPRVEAISLAVFGSTFGATATAIFITQVAISAVTSWAISALAPKPDFSSFGSQGTLVNARDPAAAADFVYGEVRKGGVATFYEATGVNNKYLHQVIVIAGHEVEEIGDIYINDKVAAWDASTGLISTAGTGDSQVDWKEKIRIRKHLGDQTTVDSDLNAETSVDTQFVGNGIAYIYVRYDYDQEVFANGIPLITVKVKGKKVYDPRTSATGYSNNAALCIRDFITSEYGLNDSAVDDVSFSAAANESDENVTLSDSAGTESRYTINGIIKASSPTGKVLGEMATACAGTLFWGSGYWKLKVGAYSAPVKTLTLDDLRGPINLKTRSTMRDSFNGVTGTFNNAADDYITSDYPAIKSTTFKVEDGNEELLLDLPLPFTTSAATAQRIAKMTLYRGREQMTINADFGLEAFNVEVGDIIAFTNERYSFDEKEFEVVGWKFESNQQGGDLRVNLTLQETSEAAFDWNAEESEIINNNTTLVSYTDVPPVGISVVADAKVSNEKVSNIAIVTVTSSRPEAVTFVEVEYKLSSDSNYSIFGRGQLGQFTVRDLTVDDYDFRARAVNIFGYKGEYEYLFDVEINAFIGDPSDVAFLTTELSGGTLFLSWPAVPDADLSHYSIKHNSNTSGATWSNSSTIIEKIGRPATSGTVPARSGTFLIRAYDKEGNFSVNPTTAVVAPSELPELGQTDSLTEDPNFTGSKTNTVVANGALRIDDVSASSPTGEYFFSNYIDTGSNRSAKITGARTFSRISDSGGILWDDIPGLWDTWPDNWDTWTQEDSGFGDVSVTVYVSPTSDDPAGSPTWGSYVLANGAFVSGRAFRFKAVLDSLNTGFTPSVSQLSVEVSY